jgi:hypothetical protein
MDLLLQALNVIGIQYQAPPKQAQPKDAAMEEHKHPPVSIRPALPYVYVQGPLRWTKLSVGVMVDIKTQKASKLYLSLRPRTSLYLGIVRSGKTNCLRARYRALADAKYFKFGLAMSLSANSSGDLDFLPKTEIQKPDHEVLCQHLEGLMALGDLYQAKNWGPPPANYLILDDVTKILGNNKNASDLFQNFITRPSHSNTSVDFAVHELTGAFPLYRKNSQHVHEYQTPSRREVDAIHEAIGLYLPASLQSAQAYREWVAKHILNYQAMLFISEGDTPKYYLFKAYEVKKGSFKMYEGKRRTPRN